MDISSTTTATTPGFPDYAQVLDLTLNTLQMIASRDAAVAEERERTDRIFQARIDSQSQAQEQLTTENRHTRLALVESEAYNQQLITLFEEQKIADQQQIHALQEENEKLRVENEKLLKLLEIANQQLAPKPAIDPQERSRRMMQRLTGRV